MILTVGGNREGFLEVLQHLYRRQRWHKGEPVEKFLRTHQWVHLDYLPPFQPGLNPQERVWRQIRLEATTNR